MNDTTKFTVVTKNVRHDFTPMERADLGKTLAMAFSNRRDLEGEFDQVKANYKARLSECDARIGSLTTDTMNGFDMRNERCVVIYSPEEGRKSFYLESVVNAIPPDTSLQEAIASGFINAVSTEPMTKEDFQTELLQAEEKFDHKESIEVFPPAGSDFGTLIVGKYGTRWYSALRVAIGKATIEERLDSEQKSFKTRSDAIMRAGNRFATWAREKFKDNAKGFEEYLAKAINAQVEKVE